MTKKKIEANKPLHRDFRIETFDSGSESEADSRTVDIAFSSEEEIQRWFGTEVLIHNRQSVTLDRLNSGAAVLVNHDTDDQVGVVERAWVGDDKRGRATIRFSKSARGEEILQDVRDGIRQLISVGYTVDEYEIQERSGQSDYVRVTGWTPFEVSVVSIPADTNVGVNRSHSDEIKDLTMTDNTENVAEVEATQTREAETATPSIDANAVREQVRTSETKRIDAIKAMADKHDGLGEMARTAIGEGLSVADFGTRVMDELGRRNNELRSKHETERPDLDLSRREKDQFSFVRLMAALGDPSNRAAQNRAGYELELCSAAEDKLPTGFNVRGSFIPNDIIYRDLTVGLDGDLVGTDHLGGSLIDVLRNNMVAMQAGVTMLPGLVGNVDIPRQASASAATWVTAEDGDATESEPTFDSVSLAPKDLACFTEVTRRLLQQSSPAIEGLVRNDLFTGIALGLDAAVYYGSGASGQPQGIDGATGVDDPTFGVATAPTYAEMLTQMKTMMTANAASGLVYIGSPDFWESMMNTPKQGSGVEGNFISNGETILGRPFLISSQLAADDFVLGNFSNIVLGEWGGLELATDPFTHSLKGKIRYVVYKTVDLGIRQPSTFSFHNAA